jgi:hypothetical protein
MEGFVPDDGDGPWDLCMEHNEATHNEDGTLTEYGEWWETEGFPEFQQRGIDQTREANLALDEWLKGNL